MRAGRATIAAAALIAGLTPVLAGAPAQAACASNTGKSISGTVVGQDDRYVNVSIGFDLVDSNGRALDGDPASATYGCAKTGGYSVPQTYLNHFVGPEGWEHPKRTRSWLPLQRAQRDRTPVMADGQPVTRNWKLSNIPSNAVGAYIEVYHRGYTGSPCKDANGNYCFNKQTLTKYGNSNKHIVPVGTAGLPIRLPMTCAHGGTAGSIQGRILDAAGQPAKVQAVYAWTETKWNAWPFYQGWGIARFGADGSYVIPSLASKQNYVLWVKTLDGRTIKRFGVPVSDCKATPLNFRI